MELARHSGAAVVAHAGPGGLKKVAGSVMLCNEFGVFFGGTGARGVD